MKFHRRSAKYLYPGKSQPIHYAISKYGFENFHAEIICEAESREALNRLECEHISRLKTFIDGGKGYNATSGGNCRDKLSAEARAKISKANKGKILPQSHPWMDPNRIQWNKGKSMSEKFRQTLRDSWKRKLGSGWVSPLLGRKLPKEQAERASKLCVGLKRPEQQKSVRCVETGAVFESQLAAAYHLFPHLAKDRVTIRSKAAQIGVATRSSTRTSYGFHWERVSVCDKPADNL